MGISLSKSELIVENFDGEGGDGGVCPSDFSHPFGPEWVVGDREINLIHQQLSELSGAPSKIDMYSLKGHVIPAVPYSVYDGDTCNFVFKYDGEWVRYRFRMIGYNSPEMRSCPEEKARAIAARDYLASRLEGKKVLLYLGDFDKYGRPLCDVYIVDTDSVELKDMFSQHVNKEMIEKGYGKVYLPR